MPTRHVEIPEAFFRTQVEYPDHLPLGSHQPWGSPYPIKVSVMCGETEVWSATYTMDGDTDTEYDVYDEDEAREKALTHFGERLKEVLADG